MAVFDRDRLDAFGAENDDAVAVAVDCLEAGIERADPERATQEAVRVDDDGLVVGDERLPLGGVERVLVLGAGKGSDRVAAALVDALAEGSNDRGSGVDDGVVIVDEPADGVEPDPVDVVVGDHPLPSERGLAASRRVRERAAAAGESTLVLVVVTGGASALLADPVEGVPLDALRDVTGSLLDAGASIEEVNAVRKHVSRVKGGRLAASAAPARVVTVAVSDVVGDDPSVIGSGPTAPDDSTYADALAVLDRYDVNAVAVRDHLESGVRGDVAETPGADASCFERTSVHVVASASTAVAGAVDHAREEGFEPHVLSETVTGEARYVGREHAQVATAVSATGGPVEPPAVLISAGETIVSVTGSGTGGPNQEFVLARALELASAGDDSDAADLVDDDGHCDDSEGDCDDSDGDPGIVVAAVDTDGRDGSTDAAGAVLTGSALATPCDRERAREALADNDTYRFLDARDALLVSGSTGVNVNDLRVLVVPAGGRSD
jgi:glycerate 2-kinase